ncbi:MULTISPECIES: hypothetical protein [Shewanella]|uniref:hypothetical protein n=1 Tax=Shewanella TaxID=22 RepID=UPI00167243EB|nr:hypothetical protein [Shewanella fodinae]MCL2905012.1 hypothetical protein [Shewanella fodinae]GGY89261.1 hypothetical protein GCM10007169_03160 [Shewanella fodinae]
MATGVKPDKKQQKNALGFEDIPARNSSWDGRQAPTAETLNTLAVLAQTHLVIEFYFCNNEADHTFLI